MRVMAVCVMLALAALAAPAAAQLSEADQQIGARGLQLLRKQDFKQLNALTAQYRGSRAKTADGLSKLILLYAGMDFMPPGIPFGDKAVRQSQWQWAFSVGEAWVKQAPSPAATIELARMHLRYAWEIHGADGHPTPENMKVFQDHLQQARQILEGNKAAGIDPNWAGTMEEIKRAEKPVVVVASGVQSAPMVIETPVTHEHDELSDRVDVNTKARWAFARDDYAALNAQAERYRQSGSKTPAGIDELFFFYQGIHQEADAQTPSLDGRPNIHRWQLVLARADKWLKTAPSPAAVIASAKLRIFFAFAWRGQSYASDVRNEDWKPFFDNLALASKILEDHKKQASIDPQWYSDMIKLATYAQWPDVKKAALYKEAFTRYPDYYPVYESASEAMLPKWGGSAEEFSAFADFATANSKAKEGRSFYAQLYQHVDCDCGDEGVTPDWKKLKPAFDDLVARYPAQWNYHRYARYACKAGDRATARAVFAKIQYPLAVAWPGDVEEYESCKAWAGSGASGK